MSHSSSVDSLAIDSSAAPTAIVPDYRLDMVGEPCPYPAVATLEAMPQLKPGEILEVISDCPQSINNIPLDARNYGYTVLDIQQDGPTIRYLIQC
ncbi:TPA: sulfurtransferase-like selenium metabolism protein YedF [Yersinia enterocolitica]|uniref:sulfurtransferase-like selenium metabolism protein YedF n=1 Tax=Yersinia enterocolitica TaxID=630 RepID=UPI0005EA3A33|nr:sulfurtransferase-like selenium metabolism protein YedF [Yersinia enterocolitica]EKN3324429.1 sulfurtransferase-like selenium metabolism protein YedF [Yersinia enterocolitica]EKN3349127.1 sulfurtransferase-like selenium metabolism protein YedF [Yersinia enterocolitica]EKN3357317.1 sulfurtransferase-like selenium metabolism protein YedF [Yersinia enterocolitica]EKN3363748.1 sulfurtransferase-like selenium metabolism protein YedF [Yersinia enterocolitica]EKN3380310.1 sulfurtransferase-like se